MKTKIKAVVVLNAHETKVIARILSRGKTKATYTITPEEQTQETGIVTDFLNRCDELSRIMAMKGD